MNPACKMYPVSTKILSSTIIFNTDNNKKKDDRCNGCWKFSFAITEINYILKYIKIENSYFKF